ncbi:MAG: gfo/Idh/MocA family oxidoreductase [Acidobacteria bacterium]|nr:MAG: gfo/Idh/MocA family oxidoreductase [Acidobacteriota bacterium]
MHSSHSLSRRSFLTTTSALAMARGASSTDRLKAGLVGCGGRGTQAVVNLLTGNENVELVAVADVFEDHLETSLDRLRNNTKYLSRDAGITVERNGKPVEMSAEDLVRSLQPRIKVDPEHHFVGFDAFKKLVKSDVDIVMLATPPGYRPQHFEAAINAGKHVFTEKPIATDPVGVRRFMAAAKKAEEKKLTVMSGAQRHAERDYIETVDKIHNGAIGDIVALNSYYLSGPVFHADARDPKWGDMEWEHRNWYSFIWICGDQIVEQHFHNIDFMNWVMDSHPLEVVASGGAAWRPREPLYGNIYDHMSSDFGYANGVRLSSHCRQYPKGLYSNVSDVIVGSKGRSNGMDMGGKGINPYVQEHIDMIKSITGAGPYINQGMRVAESTMTAIMGRESAYSGMKITWDMIMNSQQDLQPKEFDYKKQMEPMPLPVPGVYKFV